MEKLFEMFDNLCGGYWRRKCFQVITNNGSNYVLVGKLLEEKRHYLYWTHCATYWIDLMIEDIGKVPLIKKTIQIGVSLVGFIETIYK